ncbi:Ribosomal RNA large subunit methyltransferase I [Anatilimnocola aggregata]|uniref:Ribosomal RNA large subunit methyltransferase I n=1 Tax=Anatilimnocola aggregata TaxID=2528021 RepID=A0A517Y9N1_9BACT|nr:class I SAM-dependent rRNA methyltransferase [Anatilimnocola aggregata]QDU26901.1 Ribosomal RNA large subunit methyltransferase I [Anatilimnocola aggregata]
MSADLQPATDSASQSGQPVARVVLKPKKALPFYGRHPWVLAGAVDRVEPTTLAGEHLVAVDGQVVDLCNEKGKFIARGMYNSHSRIRVRLFTWREDELLDTEFFRRRLCAAIAMRQQLGYEVTPQQIAAGLSRSETATRMVFSEADGLSGLVIDRYGDYLVLQPTSLAMQLRAEMLVSILQQELQPRAIILRGEKTSMQLEGMEATPDRHWGELPETPIVIRENGIAYEVDLREGQKTGFYLDQRDNRAVAARYLQGRKVLDLFCYTGGFALNAAKLGAAEVIGIDGSKKAIAQAERNAEINGLPVKFEVGDGFQTLDQMAAENRRFEAIVLDPPKFARSRSGVNAALQAYHRLNRSAVTLLSPGGILVTNSCSGTVTPEDFRLMLSGVAQKTGRDIQLLEQRGAAADHPVAATCLETEYLKCFICRVA